MNFKEYFNYYIHALKTNQYTRYILIFMVISLLFININAFQLNRVSISVGDVSPKTFIADSNFTFKNQEEIEKRKKEYVNNPDIFYKYIEGKELWINEEFKKLSKILEDVQKISNQTTTENLYSSLYKYAEENNVNFDLIIAINNVQLSQNQINQTEESFLRFVSENGGILKKDMELKKEQLKEEVSNEFEHPVIQSYLHTIIDKRLEPTKVLDKIKTEEAKENIFHDIEKSNTINIKSGQKIVGQNEIIDGLQYKIIQQMGLVSDDVQMAKQLKLNVLYILLMIGLLLATKSVKDIYDDKNQMLLLGILFSLGTLIISISLMFELFSTHLLLFLPLIIVLTDIFVSKRISIFMNIIFSIVIIYMTSNIMLMLAYLSIGIITTLMVKNINNRSDMIKIGILSSLLISLFVFLLDGGQSLSYNFYLLLAFNVMFSFFIATPMFSFIEKQFHILTPFSLMELEHHPILDELGEKAPGSMIHSRNVAHLAKNAANKINADANLVYTGGLFHDIGKLHNPKMFTENHAHFNLDRNPMNELSPIDAAIIIKRHVKYGIELGKKLKLPQSIINLIRTHHGESVIKYFYYQACKKAEECNKKEPNAIEFQYEWGKPKTKEEGILLLSDVSEAVSKSFDDSSREYIEERLPKYLDNIIKDGQLDECDLTLNEISLIKESLIDSLVSLNLKRTKYQNQKD